ncbi:MAG: hypothetical protein Q9221_002019 [Calogaya cf. arnoldii]
MLGLYFIYKAYMRYLKYQQIDDQQPRRRSPNRRSAQNIKNRIPPQKQYPDSWHTKLGNSSPGYRRRMTIDQCDTGRDYRDVDATYRPKDRRDSARGRQIDGGQRAESIHGKRVRGIPPASRPQGAYRERQDRRARSVGQPPFPGGTYQPAVFQRNEQYPEKGQRPPGRRKFDEFRSSYPTPLPSVAVPRGKDASEGPGWKRDSMAHDWRPRSGSRTPRGHMPPMSMPQPREAAYLNPDFPKQRLRTPMNPASEGSHLISALDTESLHENRNQRVERTNDGARSFQSRDDRHDDRSSTSDRRGSDHGSRQGSWSGRSSGNNSLGERSHSWALSQDSARANAGVSGSNDAGGQKGDGDIADRATRGVDDTNGHQGPNEAHNEI